MLTGAETMLGIQISSRPCNPLSMQRVRRTRYLVGTFK